MYVLEDLSAIQVLQFNCMLWIIDQFRSHSEDASNQ